MFAKSVNMIQKNCIKIILICLFLKDAGFDAELKFLEKVAKKFTRRKIEG
jgi:hypothetical protein